MLTKQLSLFVENKPGTLNSICQILSKNNLNIQTLSLADTADFGILRLLLDDWQKAQVVLQQAGFAVKITDVLAVPVSNHPGGLSEILEVLDQNQLQVEYMYAFAGYGKDQAVMIFRFENPIKAQEILQKAQLNILEQVRLSK